MIRHVRKQRTYAPLRSDAEMLLTARILPTEWYSHQTFLQLVLFAYDELCGRSAQKTEDMGAAGGIAQLTGPHRAFVAHGDPFATAWSMRHMWKLNFNFGELAVERGEGSFLYTLHGYRDVLEAHACMIVGWLRAGTELAGCKRPRIELLQKPWQGAEAFSWRVTVA